MKVNKKRRKNINATILLLVSFTLLPGQASVASLEGNKEKSEQPSAKDILTGNTPEEKLFIFRKFSFINGTLNNFSLSSDTDLAFEMKSLQDTLFYLTPPELHEIPQVGPDPFGEELRRRFSDVPPTVPLNNALKNFFDSFKGTKKYSFSKRIPIPTNTEIDILKVLWVKSAATGSEIYAELDSLTRVSSEDLQKVLARMADRGFLARKKISPSHEFNFFGLVYIEEKSQNRKNKLYVYWPLVRQAKLIKYLDAERFLALASSEKTATDGRKSVSPKYLEEKLYRLVK